MLNLYIGDLKWLGKLIKYNKMLTLSKLRMTYKRVGKLQKRLVAWIWVFFLFQESIFALLK